MRIYIRSFISADFQKAALTAALQLDTITSLASNRSRQDVQFYLTKVQV